MQLPALASGQSVTMNRILLAFLVAPLVPLLVLGLVDLAGSSGVQGRSGNAGLFAIIMFLYVYPTTAVLGLPVFLLFSRRGWFQWWRVLVGGICIGVAPSLLSLLLPLFADVRMHEVMATLLPFAALGAAFGALGALAFRAIAFPLQGGPPPA